MALGQPICGVGRSVGSAGPRVGPMVPPLRPGASSMVKFFENMVNGQKFARKDDHIIFTKGLKTQKIFLVFFVKRKNGRKSSNMQKTILKISNMQWRKTSKVQRKC